MNLFLKKITVFLIPLVLLFVPAIISLRSSGENFTKIDNLIEENKKYLIGYEYDNYKYLKWKHISIMPTKEIIALGSSRVLQFRQDMFKGSFYNAGFTITSITDFIPFLTSIEKNKYPKYLIVGLDQWMFNEKKDDLKSIKKSSLWKNSFSYIPKGSVLFKTSKDILKGKVNVFYPSSSSKLKYGFTAKMKNTGFRNDGSIFYGLQIENLINSPSKAKDFKFQNTLKSIKQGKKHFTHGEEINLAALVEFENLIDFCQKNDIQLVTFLPPFSPTVNKSMREFRKHTYMDSLGKEIAKICKAKKIEFYDFSSLEQLQSGDDEFIDGFHGGEVSYSKMLIHMIENRSKLESVVDLSILRIDLNKAKNRYIVYDY